MEFVCEMVNHLPICLFPGGGFSTQEGMWRDISFWDTPVYIYVSININTYLCIYIYKYYTHTSILYLHTYLYKYIYIVYIPWKLTSCLTWITLLIYIHPSCGLFSVNKPFATGWFFTQESLMQVPWKTLCTKTFRDRVMLVYNVVRYFWPYSLCHCSIKQ